MDRRRRPSLPWVTLAVALVALPAALLVRQPVDAQTAEARPAEPPRWGWPERAANLVVLPADAPPDQLRAVMTGFTRSLGVRCSYCHVGDEGKPLSTYDFPSDANPKKDVAREMLRMLGSINEHMAKVPPGGAERVNVWCHTCHQGRPRPTTLEEELAEAHADGGAAAAVARYRELRERWYGDGKLDFGERPLTSYGYRLLGEGDAEGAIAIFRLGAEMFPGSGNAWDSLAEAYAAAGKRELARVFYRKSLEVDPDNENALAKLVELGEGAPSP